MGLLRRFGDKQPQIGQGTFIAETAVLVGDVVVGERCSIWYGAVLRGDVFHIRIGDETCIQDNAVLHVSHGRNATLVGSRVTVGHSVNLHGCVIRDRCIIGMGTIVLDGAEVGERCIVGAGSLVTPGAQMPPGTLVLGSPARPKRPLTAEELAFLPRSAANYAGYAARYRGEAP